MTQIKWKKDIAPMVIDALDSNPDWRFPTIRSMYYYLSDALGVIPATENGYKKLDALIVDMRKNGDIPFGRFRVERGVSGYTGGFSTDPEWLISSTIDDIIKIPDEWNLPLLYHQPVLLEVWCEKKGLLPSFEALTEEWDVKIRSPEGFSPWEFGNATIKNMELYRDERQTDEVVIIYFGDQDPSGIQIFESIKDQLTFFHVNYKIIRAGVTPDQIREHKLPKSPKDTEALQRIERDSRLPRYLDKYGRIFCELDSFISLAPEAFRSILTNHIQAHIDEEALNTRHILNESIKNKLEAAISGRRDALDDIKRQILKQILE